MGRSSKRWMSEHLRDPYVKRARKEKFRSRAAYKLLQIQRRFHLIRPGDWVLDLGAAPGGWSQLAAGIAGRKGRVIAVDLVGMAPIQGVRVLRGNLMEKETLERILSELGPRRADVILSDMAPNTSGIASLDQERSVLLVESLFDLSPLLLRRGGGAVFKVFQGKGFKELTQKTLSRFRKGRIFKPEASRSRSVEVYLIGRGYMGIG